MQIIMSNATIALAVLTWRNRYNQSEKVFDHELRKLTQEIACSDHENFFGANMHRIGPGMWRVSGHHLGEAEETIAILKA